MATSGRALTEGTDANNADAADAESAVEDEVGELKLEDDSTAGEEVEDGEFVEVAALLMALAVCSTKCKCVLLR